MSLERIPVRTFEDSSSVAAAVAGRVTEAICAKATARGILGGPTSRSANAQDQIICPSNPE